MTESSDDEQILLPVAKGADWTYVVICGTGLALSAWVGVVASPTDLQSDGSSTALAELVAFKAVAVLMAYACGAYGYGAAWRLLSPRPQMLATRSQIRFHPSLHPLPMTWQDVRSIDISEENPPKLVIRVRRRFWSPVSPVTETKIVIPLMWLWKEEQMQSHIDTMRRWHTDISVA